jgi:predicted HTH transcriptional regulator
MSANELRELIRLPESDTLEFKTRLPDLQSVSRLVSSLANTRGGNLIVGVREGGEVIGVTNPERAQTVLANAARRVSPAVALESEIVDLEGKPVLFATIQRSQSPPHLVDGRAFQRVGDRTIPITSNTLYDNIRERATDLDAVLQEVKRLTAVIEQLNEELVTARGWRGRMMDWVLGGVVGAVISILFALVLGVG